MSGSIFGKNYRVSTFGESHGRALGAIIDGVPAGLRLDEDALRTFVARRKTNQSKYSTKRSEDDNVEILSGMFEGLTTGTPIAAVVYNKDEKSRDYSNIMDVYRPGHADYTFDKKYGIRDYRGGGRSSGRETVARVIAGGIASQVLGELGVKVSAYTRSIGPIEITDFDSDFIFKNPLYMPDAEAYEKASQYVDGVMKNQDSAGGIVECVITGLKPGIGETVFDKLDAKLAHAIFSIGAVKGFEVGDGFDVASAIGSKNNDAFASDNGAVIKQTNHAGGILGGMSDGSDVVFRAAFKPTPSISQKQKSVNDKHENVELEIHGRHDPLIVPRAVVVVEAMAAITILDLMMENMHAKMGYLHSVYDI